MLPAIIGVIILAIVVYVAFKMMGSIVLGLGLIAIVFVASYFIFGSLPDLHEVPIIGGFISKYLPQLPSTTGEAIAVIRNVFYSLKVLDVARDADGNLLIIVVNTGKLELTGFEVRVDGYAAELMNKPKEPLSSGESTALQVAWKEGFNQLNVVTNQTESGYTS